MLMKRLEKAPALESSRESHLEYLCKSWFLSPDVQQRWTHLDKGLRKTHLLLCTGASLLALWLPCPDLCCLDPGVCTGCSSQLFTPAGFQYAAFPEALDF